MNGRIEIIKQPLPKDSINRVFYDHGRVYTFTIGRRRDSEIALRNGRYSAFYSLEYILDNTAWVEEYQSNLIRITYED